MAGGKWVSMEKLKHIWFKKDFPNIKMFNQPVCRKPELEDVINKVNEIVDKINELEKFCQHLEDKRFKGLETNL